MVSLDKLGVAHSKEDSLSEISSLQYNLFSLYQGWKLSVITLKCISYPPQLSHGRKNGRSCIKYLYNSTWAWKCAHTHSLHKRVLFWRRSCQLAFPTRLICNSLWLPQLQPTAACKIQRYESFQRLFTLLFWITPRHFFEHKSWWVTLEKVPSAWAQWAKTGIKASRLVGSWWQAG